MLIASIIVVTIFIIFITSTFFLTRKTYCFDFEGKKIIVKNSGSVLNIFVNDVLSQSNHMPQLIKGENFKLMVENKELTINCKTNAFGNKFSLQAYCGDQQIYDNGVKIKSK